MIDLTWIAFFWCNFVVNQPLYESTVIIGLWYKILD